MEGTIPDVHCLLSVHPPGPGKSLVPRSERGGCVLAKVGSLPVVPVKVVYNNNTTNCTFFAQ
jgi:hypothetical protein